MDIYYYIGIIMLILAWPFPSVLLIIAKYTDKLIYAKQNNISIYDPAIKEADYTWRRMAMIFWILLVFTLTVAFKGTGEEYPDADFKESMNLIFGNKAFYLSFLTFLVIGYFFTYLYKKNLDKKKFDQEEIKLINKLEFELINKRLAKKDNLSIIKKYNTVALCIDNPLKRSISFTVHNKHILYQELGSYLQEKILKLQIDIMADNHLIFFLVGDKNFDKLIKNFVPIAETLNEIVKELKYRKEAKFNYYK